MTQEGQAPPPPVMWAQRRDAIFLTISLEDCKKPTLTIEPSKIYFKGIGGTEKKLHEVTINLHGEIDAEKALKSIRGRNIEIILPRKEEGSYWPRLTKEQQKFHWLKIDFNKWKDEDESDEEGGGMEGGGSGRGLEEMMRQMGGLGGGGMGGDMKPNFDDLDMGDMGDGPDSDDDEMPDLEEDESEKNKTQTQS